MRYWFQACSSEGGEGINRGTVQHWNRTSDTYWRNARGYASDQTRESPSKVTLTHFMPCLSKASREKQQIGRVLAGKLCLNHTWPPSNSREGSFPNAEEPLSVTAQDETQITGLTSYRAVECTLKANSFLTVGTHLKNELFIACNNMTQNSHLHQIEADQFWSAKIHLLL